MTTTATAAAPERAVPSFGGFNSTLLRLEVRRMLRNRRTVIFSIVLPVVFFLLFGTGKDYSLQSAGPHGNWAAAIMISMALYGAMLSTTAGGAMVSSERSQGWSRQLRLTPLTPTAYIAVKVLVAMLLGAHLHRRRVCRGGPDAGADGPAPVVGDGARSPGWVRWSSPPSGCSWATCSRATTSCRSSGRDSPCWPSSAGCSRPLDQMGHTFQTIAKFTPMYGVSQLTHAPLTGESPGWAAVVNVLVWLAVFAGGAAWRFRRDTARV